MRISFSASCALAILVGACNVSLGQEGAVADGQERASNRRSVLVAAPNVEAKKLPEPSATVLRATTKTGVSKAEIFRQPTSGGNAIVRVAALPKPVAERKARSRARSAAPAAPDMNRKPFMVGFRRPAKQEEATLVEGAIANGTPESVNPEFISAQTPDAAKYDFTAPAAPQTNAADAQLAGDAPRPQLEPLAGEAGDSETEYCSRSCRPRPTCNLGCEKKLFPKNCNGFEIGGWISQGYHNRDNILVNNRRREWNLHQAWLYAGKEASQDSCDWDFGYRADLLYGIDAQDLQAFGNSPTGAPTGWDNSWDNGSFGWALPQLYVQFANIDWDVKVGKFFSPFGYEVIGATDNFFYSHSFTMYNSEPFTMSGVLAERKVSDTKSYVVGVTSGWDTGFESNDGGANLIFGTRDQLTDNIALAVTNSWGDTGVRGSGALTSAVAEVGLTDSVDYVLQADVLHLGTNQEFGIVQYLFREINPCLSLGARLEWWKSDQFFTSSRSTYNYTVGANYRHNANLTIRPELRFDWGAAAVDPGAPIIGFDVVRTF
jgi:hypothetical protein